MDEEEIWAFLEHFQEGTLARGKMLSDLGYGGERLGDGDDLIEETGRRRANVRGTGESPGQALGTALKAAGEKPPGPGYHAHHIVPKSARKLIEKLLERTGIKQNSALNGVWLPENALVANEYGSLLHLDYIHRNQDRKSTRLNSSP